MFGKRHPRLDEEQPLVPHGLVWQATEEAATGDKLEAEAKLEAEIEETGLEEPFQPVPPVQESNAAPSVPSTPSTDLASRAIPFWQKLNTLETGVSVTISGIPTESGCDKDNRSTAMPVLPEERLDSAVDHIQPDRPLTKLKARNLVLTVRESVQKRLDALTSRFKKNIRAIANRCVAIAGAARTQVFNNRPRERAWAKYWETSKTRVGLAYASVAAGGRDINSMVQRGLKRLKSQAQAGLAARSARVQRDSASAEPPMPALDAQPIAEQVSEVPNLVKPAPWAFALGPVLSRRVRMRIPRQDVRLWTSFAMAGLSAVLTLGFISAIRHYAGDALPSHAVQTTSLPVCSPPENASSVPQKAASPVKPVRSGSRTAAVSPVRVNAARAAKPSPRHIHDEDYVARDTYVSYVNQRKASH